MTSTMYTRPFCPLKWRLSNLAKILLALWLGNLWDSSWQSYQTTYKRHDDRFPLSLWEVWFRSSIGGPIPALIGPPQQCVCNSFQYDSYGDHLQTCQTKSAASQVHVWVVYKLGSLLDSVHGNRLPPPRTLILDFTMTHTRYGWSIQHTTGQLTHIRRSDGAPEPDGALQKVVMDKIRHCCQIYLNRPDPIAFMSVGYFFS
jgi:hypothetical protein